MVKDEDDNDISQVVKDEEVKNIVQIVKNEDEKGTRQGGGQTLVWNFPHIFLTGSPTKS